MARPTKRDLLVLGGGVGGLVTASVASQLGLKVTLIEARDRLGGDCLHTGCVPSKALLHCARLIHQQRQAAAHGLTTAPESVDIAAVNAYIHSVIDTLQRHDDPERFRSYGCEVLFGAGRFAGPSLVEINGELRKGRRIVIATGSAPFVPPIDGLADAGFLTNEAMFSLDTLPEHLAVLGGGPIGIEMAQAFRRLGSRVTVLVRGDTILPNDDPELTALMQRRLVEEGVEFIRDCELLRVDKAVDGQRRLTLRLSSGDESQLAVDQLLVATGRIANTKGLELARAGIEVDRQGIVVDRHLRTSNRRVFACGDVCGPYRFTHMAEYQAGIVISNALFRFPRRVDYSQFPWVTYTDPELAGVGLSEQQAMEQGLDVEVLRFPFDRVDRAVVEDSTLGLTKFVVRKGKILGASILGPNAGELLHEIVLAMKGGIGIGSISTAIHAYPTLSQIHRRTVNTHYSSKLFSPMSRQLVKWLNRLLP